MIPLYTIFNSCFARICEFVIQIYNLFVLRFAFILSLSLISIHSCRCNNICHTHHSFQVQDIRFRRHTFRQGFYECILAHRHNPHQACRPKIFECKHEIWSLGNCFNFEHFSIEQYQIY